MTPETRTALDPLIGREGDLRSALGLIAASRLVTFTGPGGSGKSRLARAASTELQATGKAWFVDCSAARTFDVVASTIAATVDAHAAGDAPLAAIAAAVGGPGRVLVLDNLEQVEDAAAGTAALLEAATELHVIATSRRPLGARGEVEFPVRPLDLPAADTKQAIEASGAGSLFMERGRAAQGDIALGESSASEIAELLRRLDGLPLAIELAAARTRVMTVTEINQRLDAFGLASIDRPSDDEHRSMRAVVEWTIGQLGPADTAVLEAVAVCAGFDLALVEALTPDRDVLSALESLVALGLVKRVGLVNDASRFMLLETIRAAVVRAMSQDRRSLLADRHAAHFVAVASGWQSSMSATRGRAPVAAFDADADNIRLALDHLEGTDLDGAFALHARLGPFWSSHGRGLEGYERFRRMAGAAPSTTADLVRAAVSQIDSVNIVLSSADYLAFQRWTADQARIVGDARLRAAALRSLLATASNHNDAALLHDVMAELEALVDPNDASMSWYLVEARSWVSMMVTGPTSDATVNAIAAAVTALKQAGEHQRAVAYQANLASARFARGEYRIAAELIGEVVARYREVDRLVDAAWAMVYQAPCLVETGRFRDAVDAAIECILLNLEFGHPENVASAMWSAIPVAVAAGDARLAGRLYGAVFEGMAARGEIAWPPRDRVTADGWLQRLDGSRDRIQIEVAIREGARAEVRALLRSLPDALRALRQASPRLAVRHGSLTRREVEVLELIGLGRSDPEIAKALFISPKTASVHLANIKAKLGVDSRLQVALRARELGLVREGWQEEI